MPARDLIRDIYDDKRFNSSIIIFASSAIVILSAVLIIAFGIKSFSILLIIPIVYYSIRSVIFPVLLLIVVSPILLTIFPTGLNLFSYGIIALVILLWAFRLEISAKKMIEFPRSLSIYFLLFLFFSFISMLNKSVSSAELLAYIRFVMFFAFVIALYNICDKRDIIKILVAMTIPILVSIYYIVSVYSHATNIFQILDLMRNKVTGFLPSANLFGLIIMAAISFWISISLWWDNKRVRRIAGVISLVLIVGLLLTNSRSAIFGFAMSLLVFSIFKKKLKYYIGILVLALAIVAVVPSARTLLTLAFRMDRGTSSRVDIWKTTVKIIESNVALGVGVGNYHDEYYKHYPLAEERWFFGRMPHAHNLILTKMAELGIPGLFLALALYVIPIRACLRLLKGVTNQRDRLIVYGFVATFFAYFAHSIFEGGGILQEGRLYPDILFWIWLVILLKMDSRLKNSGNVENKVLESV